MPKKSPKRRRGKYIRGKVEESGALGALASGTLFAGDFDENVNERSLISSIVCTWSINEHTPDQGSITVGLAHGDYTATEIAAWLANTGSWNEGNKTSQEIANRLIRTVGTFPGALAQESLNDGRMIKTKLNWILNQGESLRSWAINNDTSTLTTGTLLRLDGHANIWPR